MNRVRFAGASAALAGILLVTGCSDEQSISPANGEDDAFGHTHGLGVDPADDSLYIATHFGLFHLDESGNAARVADRKQDTMAFTVVGPGHFLASGHPDPREDLPPHLGLIESTDAGQTWSPVALRGEADFHILEPAADVLYAYDAITGRLLRTRDRATFDEILTAPLISVTVSPEDSGRLIATTGQGELIRIDVETGVTSDLGGPTTVLLDTAPDGSVVGIDPAGVVRTSPDAGQTWRELGTVGGAPAAFTISEHAWYAATGSGVFRSVDDGESWSRVL